MRIISLGAKVDASINLQWNSILFFFHNATKVRIKRESRKEEDWNSIQMYSCYLLYYYLCNFLSFSIFSSSFSRDRTKWYLYPAIINRETKSQFFGHTSDLILGNVCANVVSRRVGEAGRPTVVGRELFVRAEAMHTRAVHTQTYTRRTSLSVSILCTRVTRLPAHSVSLWIRLVTYFLSTRLPLDLSSTRMTPLQPFQLPYCTLPR